MGNTVTINVTARRIERAKKLLERGAVCAVCCPVALAAKPVVPGFKAVGTTQIKTRRRWICLPIEAQQFIATFDAKGVVRPIKFEVTL